MGEEEDKDEDEEVVVILEEDREERRRRGSWELQTKRRGRRVLRLSRVPDRSEHGPARKELKIGGVSLQTDVLQVHRSHNRGLILSLRTTR